MASALRRWELKSKIRAQNGLENGTRTAIQRVWYGEQNRNKPWEPRKPGWLKMGESQSGSWSVIWDHIPFTETGSLWPLGDSSQHQQDQLSLVSSRQWPLDSDSGDDDGEEDDAEDGGGENRKDGVLEKYQPSSGTRSPERSMTLKWMSVLCCVIIGSLEIESQGRCT